MTSNNKLNNDIYFKIIKLLLNLNIDLYNPSYFPILNMVCSKNNLHILKLIIKHLDKNDKKKLINFIDHLNFTPLIHAISNNNFEMTKFLLQENADYNYISPIGNIQVFFTAIRFNNNLIINELLKYDIDLTFTNNNLDTVIHFVLKNKFLNNNLIKKILIKFNNFNMQNIKGNTPTHLLFKFNKWDEFLDIIKTKNIDFSLKNKEKRPL